MDALLANTSKDDNRLVCKGVDKVAYKEIDESNIILIDSVSSFIEMIKQVKETKEAQDGTSTELYFRGQETEFWDIEPSIFRDDMLSIEHKLMQIPLQKSPTEFRDLKSMFDIMTKYQHYGMCTRLLDLTTNPVGCTLLRMLKSRRSKICYGRWRSGKRTVWSDLLHGQILFISIHRY